MKTKSNLKRLKRTDVASSMAMVRVMAAGGLADVHAIATDQKTDSWLRLAAWRLLFEYAWGKPKQQIAADVSHQFVLRAPEVLTDEQAWERKWGPQLANREPVTLPTEDNPAPDDWPNGKPNDIFRRS